MDDNQFRFIEKLFQESEKRSEQRHSDLIIRLDERFDFQDHRMDQAKLNADVRFSGHEGRMTKIENELDAFKEATSATLVKLEKSDAKQSLVTAILGAIGGAVLATLSAIAAAFIGRG